MGTIIWFFKCLKAIWAFIYIWFNYFFISVSPVDFVFPKPKVIHPQNTFTSTRFFFFRDEGCLCALCGRVGDRVGRPLRRRLLYEIHDLPKLLRRIGLLLVQLGLPLEPVRLPAVWGFGPLRWGGVPVCVQQLLDVLPLQYLPKLRCELLLHTKSMQLLQHKRQWELNHMQPIRNWTIKSRSFDFWPSFNRFLHRFLNSLHQSTLGCSIKHARTSQPRS